MSLSNDKFAAFPSFVRFPTDSRCNHTDIKTSSVDELLNILNKSIDRVVRLNLEDSPNHSNDHVEISKSINRETFHQDSPEKRLEVGDFRIRDEDFPKMRIAAGKHRIETKEFFQNDFQKNSATGCFFENRRRGGFPSDTFLPRNSRNILFNDAKPTKDTNNRKSKGKDFPKNEKIWENRGKDFLKNEKIWENKDTDFPKNDKIDEQSKLDSFYPETELVEIYADKVGIQSLSSETFDVQFEEINGKLPSNAKRKYINFEDELWTITPSVLSNKDFLLDETLNQLREEICPEIVVPTRDNPSISKFDYEPRNGAGESNEPEKRTNDGIGADFLEKGPSDEKLMEIPDCPKIHFQEFQRDEGDCGNSGIGGKFNSLGKSQKFETNFSEMEIPNFGVSGKIDSRRGRGGKLNSNEGKVNFSPKVDFQKKEVGSREFPGKCGFRNSSIDGVSSKMENSSSGVDVQGRGEKRVEMKIAASGKMEKLDFADYGKIADPFDAKELFLKEAKAGRLNKPQTRRYNPSVRDISADGCPGYVEIELLSRDECNSSIVESKINGNNDKPSTGGEEFSRKRTSLNFKCNPSFLSLNEESIRREIYEDLRGTTSLKTPKFSETRLIKVSGLAKNNKKTIRKIGRTGGKRISILKKSSFRVFKTWMESKNRLKLNVRDKGLFVENTGDEVKDEFEKKGNRMNFNVVEILERVEVKLKRNRKIIENIREENWNSRYKIVSYETLVLFGRAIIRCKNYIESSSDRHEALTNVNKVLLRSACKLKELVDKESFILRKIQSSKKTQSLPQNGKQDQIEKIITSIVSSANAFNANLENPVGTAETSRRILDVCSKLNTSPNAHERRGHVLKRTQSGKAYLDKYFKSSDNCANNNSVNSSGCDKNNTHVWDKVTLKTSSSTSSHASKQSSNLSRKNQGAANSQQLPIWKPAGAIKIENVTAAVVNFSKGASQQQDFEKNRKKSRIPSGRLREKETPGTWKRKSGIPVTEKSCSFSSKPEDIARKSKDASGWVPKSILKRPNNYNNFTNNNNITKIKSEDQKNPSEISQQQQSKEKSLRKRFKRQEIIQALQEIIERKNSVPLEGGNPTGRDVINEESRGEKIAVDEESPENSEKLEIVDKPAVDFWRANADLKKPTETEEFPLNNISTVERIFEDVLPLLSVNGDENVQIFFENDAKAPLSGYSLSLLHLDEDKTIKIRSLLSIPNDADLKSKGSIDSTETSENSVLFENNIVYSRTEANIEESCAENRGEGAFEQEIPDNAVVEAVIRVEKEESSFDGSGFKVSEASSTRRKNEKKNFGGKYCVSESENPEDQGDSVFQREKDTFELTNVPNENQRPEEVEEKLLFPEILEEFKENEEKRETVEGNFSETGITKIDVEIINEINTDREEKLETDEASLFDVTKNPEMEESEIREDTREISSRDVEVLDLVGSKTEQVIANKGKGNDSEEVEGKLGTYATGSFPSLLGPSFKNVEIDGKLEPRVAVTEKGAAVEGQESEHESAVESAIEPESPLSRQFRGRFHPQIDDFCITSKTFEEGQSPEANSQSFSEPKKLIEIFEIEKDETEVSGQKFIPCSPSFERVEEKHAETQTLSLCSLKTSTSVASQFFPLRKRGSFPSTSVSSFAASSEKCVSTQTLPETFCVSTQIDELSSSDCSERTSEIVLPIFLSKEIQTVCVSTESPVRIFKVPDFEKDQLEADLWGVRGTVSCKFCGIQVVPLKSSGTIFEDFLEPEEEIDSRNRSCEKEEPDSRSQTRHREFQSPGVAKIMETNFHRTKGCVSRKRTAEWKDNPGNTCNSDDDGPKGNFSNHRLLPRVDSNEGGNSKGLKEEVGSDSFPGEIDAKLKILENQENPRNRCVGGRYRVLLPVVYATVCSFVFWALEFSMVCELS